MKIQEQKHGALSESDRLELARLLLKAGYTVRIGRDRPPGKSTGAWVWYVQFEEGSSCLTTSA